MTSLLAYSITSDSATLIDAMAMPIPMPATPSATPGSRALCTARFTCIDAERHWSRFHNLPYWCILGRTLHISLRVSNPALRNMFLRSFLGAVMSTCRGRIEFAYDAATERAGCATTTDCYFSAVNVFADPRAYRDPSFARLQLGGREGD